MGSRSRLGVLVLAAALLALVAAPARGESSARVPVDPAPVSTRVAATLRPPSIVPGYGGPPVLVQLGGERSSPVGFRSAPGTLDVWRGKLALSTAGPWLFSEAPYVLPLLSLEAESSVYDFRRAGTIVPGAPEPWRELDTATVWPSALVWFDEHRHLVLSARLTCSGEPGARLSDSLTEGAYVGFGFDVGETLTLTPGIIALTRLEHRPLVLPAPGFRFRPTPRLEVRLDQDGLRATVQLVPPTLRLALGGTVDLREYRLSRRRSVLAGGVARDERIVATAALAWAPVVGLELQVTGGCVAWEELVVDDALGRVVTRNTLAGVAPEVGARVSVQF